MENRQKRLKSNIQTYDIRDSYAFAGALEIEKLLQTKMAKEARAVDMAAVFKEVVTNAKAGLKHDPMADSFDTDSDME